MQSTPSQHHQSLSRPSQSRPLTASSTMKFSFQRIYSNPNSNQMKKKKTTQTNNRPTTALKKEEYLQSTVNSYQNSTFYPSNNTFHSNNVKSTVRPNTSNSYRTNPVTIQNNNTQHQNYSSSAQSPFNHIHQYQPMKQSKPTAENNSLHHRPQTSTSYNRTIRSAIPRPPTGHRVHSNIGMQSSSNDTAEQFMNQIYKLSTHQRAQSNHHQPQHNHRQFYARTSSTLSDSPYEDYPSYHPSQSSYSRFTASDDDSAYYNEINSLLPSASFPSHRVDNDNEIEDWSSEEEEEEAAVEQQHIETNEEDIHTFWQRRQHMTETKENNDHEHEKMTSQQQLAMPFRSHSLHSSRIVHHSSFPSSSHILPVVSPISSFNSTNSSSNSSLSQNSVQGSNLSSHQLEKVKFNQTTKQNLNMQIMMEENNMRKHDKYNNQTKNNSNQQSNQQSENTHFMHQEQQEEKTSVANENLKKFLQQEEQRRQTTKQQFGKRG